MKLKVNIIKGFITSLIGVVTMLITLLLVFMGDMDFIWNGIAGIAIGCTLLLAPQTIEKKFSEIIITATSSSKPKASADEDSTEDDTKKDDFDELDKPKDQKPE